MKKKTARRTRSQQISEEPGNARELRDSRYVQGLIDGKSMQQAALDAGFSETTARVACRDIMPRLRGVFQSALHHRISVGKLSDTISAGLDAKKTEFFQHQGVVTDEREVIAWSERRESAKLAANLMGLEPPKDADGGAGVSVTIQMVDIGGAVVGSRAAVRVDPADDDDM